MENTWRKIKTCLGTKIPEHSFKMWIEPLSIVRKDDGHIQIVCPNGFTKKRIQAKYRHLIEEEIRGVVGESCSVSFVLGKKRARQNINNLQMKLPCVVEGIKRLPPLRSDFTFDQFVVGKSNGFAYAATLSLAAKKTQHQNAIFLLSKTGLGKSHLSQAVGHFILKKNPDEVVCYMTAEDFSNEMIDSFKNDTFHLFKEKYRKNCDVLLLEDIHYLSGKERTQTELSYALDSLYNAGKRIIFSSCYPPGEIPKLNEKLRSRLSCGVISVIEPPEFKTRLKILKKKAAMCGYDISEDVLHYLASEIPDDVRQLTSGLIGVAAQSSLMGIKVDVKLAESVVKTMARRRERITIEGIKRLVARYYRVSVEDLESRSRKQSVVRPRHIAIYLARKFTDHSLSEIGRSFNRYHATALHAIGAIESEVRQNTRICEELAFLRKKLTSGEI